MSKRRVFFYSLLGLVIIGLASLFFFTDLNISKSFASDNPSFLVTLLDAIGEFPIYFGPLFFALIYGFTTTKKNYKLLFHLFGLVVTYVASVRLIGGIFDSFYSSKLGILQYCLLAVESLLIYLLLMILFSKFKYDNLVKLRGIALVYLIVSASSFAIVTIIKLIWGRMRFFALSSDYHEYTNFLTINLGNGLSGSIYNSFPSGHTNAATSSLVLILIPLKLSSKKWLTWITTIITFIYILLVGFSRVRYGVHYASDVLFGFTISICCFIVTCEIFNKKGWLNVRND